MDHLIFVKLACIPNFSFLGELEVTFPGGWVAGPTLIIRLSQFNLTKFDCQLELSLATFSYYASSSLANTRMKPETPAEASHRSEGNGMRRDLVSAKKQRGSEDIKERL